jgi:hypothetical protein
MERTKSDNDEHYAHWTFIAGTRPFAGIEMILSNMVENFKELTSHPCGSYSATNDVIARNAISDTAIVMSYSLLEGFFHEEFEYYMKKKGRHKPKELSALISALLHERNVSISDWRRRRKLIDLTRVLRNAAVHCNGIIENNVDIDKCEEILGEDAFEWGAHYPRLSLVGSICLLKEFKNIASEYSEAVYIGSTKGSCSRNVDSRT